MADTLAKDDIKNNLYISIVVLLKYRADFPGCAAHGGLPSQKTTSKTISATVR
jgi:hypothetical protein